MRIMKITVLSTEGSTFPTQVIIASVPKIGENKDLIRALSTACCLGDYGTLLVAEEQDRSTVICCTCKEYTLKCVPFWCLDLPVPSETERQMTLRSITLTVLSSDGSTMPTQFTVTVPENGKNKDLIRALSTACSLRDDETLLMATIFHNRIIEFRDELEDSLRILCENDVVVAYRLLKDEDSWPLVVFMHRHEV
ncbi:ubiquitin carboxyl-terminal hydrolase 8-like [Rutidosis leptorrhynchoides]|uniref:ubiquitin carboxyl-terminal hydrolase 8-like n=1 Tax=Rutidosis leptorrhynchoides TaxID=125765 RepID=UPI003A9A654E